MAKKKSKTKKKKAKKKDLVERPADVNQLAHFLGAEATKEIPSDTPVSRTEISRVMAALGRKGGRIGGKNRAASLTPEKRREIALKAARTRWDAPTT